MQIGQSLVRGSMNLTFAGHEKQGGGYFDADAFTLSIGHLMHLRFTLRAAHPLLQTPDDAQVHFNVEFQDLDFTPDVHGVLGQTYRNGREKRAMDYSSLSRLLHRSVAADSDMGAGFLDGKVKGYEATSVLAPDCEYTAFGGHQLPAIE